MTIFNVAAAPILHLPLPLPLRKKKKSKMKISRFICFTVFVLLQDSVHGRVLPASLPKPLRDDAVAFARWLVSQNSWGVLSTIYGDWGGAPFGNVVSFSDGLPDKGKGIPYFYLTTLDPTASNALKDKRASLTLSEYNLGTCGNADPENPTCSKITLVGELKLIEGTEEAEFARDALFAKHSDMKSWPKSHGFQVYKLEIKNIFMINWFGGPKPLTVEQYLQPKLNNASWSNGVLLLFLRRLFLVNTNTADDAFADTLSSVNIF